MYCVLRWLCFPAVNLAWSLALVLGFSVKPSPAPVPQPPAAERAHVAFNHALPPLDGSRLHVTIVEVNYGPGESSAPHTHPCPVVGYVLEGSLRTQVAGQPQAVYHPGESFYEAPNGVHLVSANAGAASPAKFLAFFVCDNDTPLSSPVSASKSTGAN
jgi:quercetin dioxygenase-like cupin family protein